MISVCIPVFNVDVRKLAEKLFVQAADLSSRGVPVEIILLDDGSEESYRRINRSLRGTAADQGKTDSPLDKTDSPLDKTDSDQSDNGINEPVLLHYHELEENIGRARIRNRFLEHAKYPHLLFMDCDLKITSGDFLEVYADTIRQHPDRVIVGGCNYSSEKPSLDRRLHWKYGIRKESRPAEVRRQAPNQSFMTSNFVIPLDLLKEIRFDERLSQYGHEDSLFGYELTKKGQEILHIDNPVIHEGLETNRVFVEKTSEAVKNLVYIIEITGNEKGFRDSIKLIRRTEKLRASKPAGLLLGILILFHPMNRFLLNNGCRNLKMLDAFKLVQYIKASRENESEQ